MSIHKKVKAEKIQKAFPACLRWPSYNVHNQRFAVLCSHANLHTCRVCVSLPLVTHSPTEMPRVQICLKRESFIWICLSIFFLSFCILKGFAALKRSEMSASGMCGVDCVAQRFQIIGDDLIDFPAEISPTAAAFAA